MTLFFSDLFGLGGKRCAGRFAHKRGRKSRRVQVNAAAAWRDEDCRGSLERRDEGYVGKISNNNKDEGRRRGEWRGTRSRADFRESLGTDLEGEIEHDADDAVRWGEGEKAGDGSGGPWHSFECLGQRQHQRAREERRVERRYLRRARIVPQSRGTSMMQP